MNILAISIAISIRLFKDTGGGYWNIIKVKYDMCCLVFVIAIRSASLSHEEYALCSDVQALHLFYWNICFVFCSRIAELMR